MNLTDAEMEAFLDEALPADAMKRIEQTLRGDPWLAKRLALIGAQRDSGAHSLAGIWRAHRLSCPTREQLGSYLLGALDPQAADFVTFHTQTSGCRACQANLDDLRYQQTEAAAQQQSRRRKYFQSSAGKLRRG
jgi:anti-sigma factor RsiW